MQPLPRPSFAVSIASVGLIGPLAVHIFMPIIPGIRAAFSIDDATAQFVFSISLFTMAFATLVYGSLADRFGRRPILLTGLGLFLAGSILCSLAPNVPVLVAGRILQAVGAGCGVTLARTIARDAYGPERLVKAIAYLTMFYTIGPMIAPMAGGFLFDHFGWRSVFAFSSVCAAAIVAAAAIFVPETRPKGEALAADKPKIIGSYVELFSHPRFVAFVFQTGLSSAVFFTMASAASTLMKDILDRPASEFGVYFFLFPLGYLAGNAISARARYSVEAMVLVGSVIALLTTIGQTLCLASGLVSPLTLFIPGFFVTFAQGIALPFGQAGAMSIVPRLAGTSSGIGVFLQSFLGGLFAQLYGILADKTVWPLIYVTCAGSALVMLAGLYPWLKKGMGHPVVAAERPR